MIATIFLCSEGTAFLGLARGEDMPKAKTVLRVTGIILVGLGLLALGAA